MNLFTWPRSDVRHTPGRMSSMRSPRPRALHQSCRALCGFALTLIPLQRAYGWGDDGHKMVMAAAIAALPEDSRRIFARAGKDLAKLCVEPDAHSGAVPAEACKHWINIEKFDPGYLAALTSGVTAAEADGGVADEDLRGLGALMDKERFAADPPPYRPDRVAKLWDALPGSISFLRATHGRAELHLGTVVYQPYLYARAFAGAVARGDRRRAIQYAGWLGHYAADLHVPVHVTANYKGQYSGNLIFDDRERGDLHVRFETAYVKSEKAWLKREMERRMPPVRTVAGTAITPLAIAAARDAYAKLPAVVAADLDAAKTADPRRDWSGFLRAATPAWREIAAAQLTGAAALLATCLHSAQQPGFSGTMAP